MKLMERWDLPAHNPCPIPLTPDNAFKWRDWAVEKYGSSALQDAFAEIYKKELDHKWPMEIAVYRWLFKEATPAHYIKAACLCKIESEK
jgi:hypothetical protein